MKNPMRILILMFVFCVELLSQTSANLKVAQNLVDSSVVIVSKNLAKPNKINIEINTPENLSYLRNYIQKSFSSKLTISDSSFIIIKYNLDEAKVEYSEIEKDGFFGNYNVKRKIDISGNFLMLQNGKSLAADNFLLSQADYIKVEEISELENPSLPFTQGKIPKAPLLSSLYEPIIAISAIAVTVYLLFSVRGK